MIPTLVTTPSLNLGQLILILETIGNWIFGFALVIAPIMIVVGVFMWANPFHDGGADPQQVQKAKDIFTWTAVGFILALLAKGIFTFIGNFLT